MSAMTVFDSEQARVEVHVKELLVNLTWKGSATGDTYRAPVQKLIEVVKEHGLKYFLSDTRNMGPILFADTEWTERVVLPQLIAAGLMRSAVLSSRDVLNMIAVDNMVASIPAEAPYVVAYFAEPGPALEWLYKDAPMAMPDIQGQRTAWSRRGTGLIG